MIVVSALKDASTGSCDLGTTRIVPLVIATGLPPFPLTSLLDLSMIARHALAMGFGSRVNAEFFPYG
jgi:hypothetical protein